MFISCTQCFVLHIMHSSARLHDYINIFGDFRVVDFSWRGADGQIGFPAIALGPLYYYWVRGSITNTPKITPNISKNSIPLM